MSDQLTNAREALMAELLQDVDTLVSRVEHVHETLPGLIEQATKDAAGKAFLTARLNLESVIDQQAHKLTDAGRHAAALIGTQIVNGATEVAAASQRLRKRAWVVLALAVAFGFGVALVGGYVGARLAGAG
ncbi:MAG: hypothetical protein ACXWC4_00625 [Telluria sp.]